MVLCDRSARHPGRYEQGKETEEFLLPNYLQNENPKQPSRDEAVHSLDFRKQTLSRANTSPSYFKLT